VKNFLQESEIGKTNFSKKIRNIKEITYFKTFYFLGFKITPLPMDHSMENTAYLIEEDGKSIFYTGDYYIGNMTKIRWNL